MRVRCEMKCRENDNGYCRRPEIDILTCGNCGAYRAKPEFDVFREDNVVIFDKAGLPSIMVKLTRNPEKPVHPMFVIGGKTYDEVYISKYPNVIINGKAYSLPLQKPAVNVTQEDAEKACFSKGDGWHLMTAMERGYIANLCNETGIFPHGNTNGGVYHDNPKEKGTTFDGYGKTLTGSGPETWTHDHTVFGIHDLGGNVWERLRGLRLMDGVFQVSENNDAAMEIDLSEGSENWKPVMCCGKPIRLDFTKGEVTFTTCEKIDADYCGCKWGDVYFDCEQIQGLKDLGLFPGESEAYFYADTNGERLPICGGHWNSGARAGVFDVYFSGPRSNSYLGVGFRSAFYRKLESEN